MARVLVAAPRWLRKHGTPRQPAQLDDKPCLLQVTTTGTPIRWRLQRGDDATGATEVRGMRGVFRSTSPSSLQRWPSTALAPPTCRNG
jgi:hypothetical protein